MSLGTLPRAIGSHVRLWLNTNGQAISLSYKVKVGLDSAPLKEASKQASGKLSLLFPGGTHDLWMRYWLAAGGINPEQDVSDLWCRHRRWYKT